MFNSNKKIELALDPVSENIMNKIVPTKILIVDDDRANLMVACHYLDEFGYKYETAMNGENAVSKFKTGDFKIILMDIQMYKMDGYQATTIIRAFEKENKLAPVYIIALTANAFVDDREKCINSGMDDYLSKPINFDNLNSMLAKRMAAGK